MALYKLAIELEETARQTAEMVEGIAASLSTLGDTSLDCAAARAQAIKQIVQALQMQDRIEQRSRSIVEVARRLAAFDRPLQSEDARGIWASLSMDELREDALSGGAARARSGEVDLF